MNSTPVTLPCTSSTTATGVWAAARLVKPTKPIIAANRLFIGNLNKAIVPAKTRPTIADGGIPDNPSLGMNKRDSSQTARPPLGVDHPPGTLAVHNCQHLTARRNHL